MHATAQRASGGPPDPRMEYWRPTGLVTEHRPNLINEGLSTKNVSRDRRAGVGHHPAADLDHYPIAVDTAEGPDRSQLHSWKGPGLAGTVRISPAFRGS